MTPMWPIGSREDSLQEPSPPLAHSYWSPESQIWLPASQITQKYHQKQVDALNLRLKNHLNNIFREKPLTSYNSNTFFEEYVDLSIKNIFISGHFELYLFKVSTVIYVWIRVNTNLEGYKKVCMRVAGSHIWILGDQQKAGKTLCESPPPPTALLLVTWESFMIPSRPE
jgi:hypothetical protein